jgi:rhamnulose-1-phosphate aldolase/alcohol dehydrogenase
MPQNFWNDQHAAGRDLLDLLVYRSNLLGTDRSVCNIFGGNTGSKTSETDFRGRPVPTLWVKGSGSDLATMRRKDFAGLRLDDINPLFEREAMSDEEMTAYLAQCLLGLNMPRQSIETLLHAFIPAAHTDHTHPDAVIALACSAGGEQNARQVYGARMAWVPYIRPGFALSKQIGQALRDNPQIECVVMGKHGLVTWDDDPRACYNKTIRVIGEAEEFIAHHARGRSVFGALSTPPLPPDQRQSLAAQLMPALRGAICAYGRSVLAFDDRPHVLDFVGAQAAHDVSQVGSACPDHLVHTKHWPLFVAWDAATGDVATLADALREGVAGFVARYQQYFHEHAGPGDSMFNPAPRVVLVPGLGLFSSGKDAGLAQVARDLYERAIAAMHGASAIDRFVSLTPSEAFGVEYWPLEAYKLTLRPPDRELAGRVALITGGASGIGRASAYRLAAEGAHVLVADLNAEGAEQVAADITHKHGARRGLALACDVGDEEEVARAFEQAALAYGGVDIVVSNAGLAFSAPIGATSAADWDRLFAVLARGYFLVARAAFRLWEQQGTGGNLVFVASKNGLIGSKNAAAYGAAKAAEINLARCLAEEGGPLGVRVNVVNPDAVLHGSAIWDSQWREARARGMGVAPEQLEEAYRQRTTLKVNVYPEDIAEAILFLASDRSAKTTGAILNVDGGLPAAYVR